jgi:hypothetical protein
MDMKIKLPIDHQPERTWVLKTILGEFLGLDFSLEYQPGLSNYQFSLSNGNQLVIQDDFFGKYPDDLSYLTEESIPQRVQWIDHDLFPEGNFPVLFGTPRIEQSDNTIDCLIDIPAAVFFALSRWEEHVLLERDEHDRFPKESALAYKNDFLQRPIVNEAVEFIWNCLVTLGIQQERKKRTFEIIPTHDIDRLRENYLLIRRALTFLRFGKINLERNPYDIFHDLMDLSEQGGWTSRFNFLGCGTERIKYDGRYDPQDHLLKERMGEIIERGHIVGFHPGYYTYLDSNRMRVEKARLEENEIPSLTIGRQHYIRFKAPQTWRIWEELGMDEDQTLTYPSQEGFRCGTGDSYQVFDIVKRKELKLRECPLIVMDVTLTALKYRNLSPEGAGQVLAYYKNIAKKYRMKLTVLYHNDYFAKEPNIWPIYKTFIID